MKTFKAIITIVLLIFCVSTVICQDKKTKLQNNTLADITIDKLDKDVQLTDSQKTVLKEKFNTLIKKSENADKKTNKKEGMEQKIAANVEYEQYVDSILTNDQKLKKMVKAKERENKDEK